MSIRCDLKDKSNTWQIFDLISQRYDFLNRFLSLGIDRYWRRVLVGAFPKKKDLVYVDLATGTGDVILAALRLKKLGFSRVIGLDRSENMLAIAKDKLSQAKLPVEIRCADAANSPIEALSVDVVTMAFGIRNVADVSMVFRDIYRMLKPGATLLILEFSLPENRAFRFVYLFYFRRILPFLGRLFSGHRYAYGYLNQSVEDFPYGEAFVAKVEDAGFESVTCRNLSFGIVSIYEAKKPVSCES
ncbi:MAG: ubiquinone/menaquinone biosynthesis methyltransferase [bacterium]